MFQWAQSTFDKLSQHVAPPPEDGPGKFAYCVQRGDEDGAMGCIASMDPIHTVVNGAKGQYPIHLACQYSCQKLLSLLLNQPGINVGQVDMIGNTPLHYASMSTAPNGLDVVKLLISQYDASVLSRNAQGQTPYDVAVTNAIRQHLLPIQLQAETRIALDNGGQGLPPGIDMGGLRINNSTTPPPPTFAGGGSGGAIVGPPVKNAAAVAPPPQQHPGPPVAAAISPVQTPNMPARNMFGTPSPGPAPAVSASAPTSGSQVAPAPSSGRHEYSRVGSSSAALGGKYRADGFHSSSSDVGLQKKYGHAQSQTYHRVPPPPSSGSSSGGSALGAQTPSPDVPNPFSAGGRTGSAGVRYGALNRSRYVAYGQVGGLAAAPAPAPVSASVYSNYAAPNVNMFAPGGTAAPSSFGEQQPPVASPASGPTSPYMPPPPYQAQPYSPAQNSVNMADANAENLFAQPSPQKADPKQHTEPVAGEPAPTPEPEAERAVVESTAPATESTSALPVNWVETLDPSSGQVYYYNSVTQETSWEKPVVLPANWVETTDPNSDQVYYYNSLTQETSWERPQAESTADTTPSSDAGPVSTPSEIMPAGESATEAFASSSPAPQSSAEAFSAPPTSTDGTVQETIAAAETQPVTEGTVTEALGAPAPTATSIAPAPISASEAFAAPAPVVSAHDAFGSPAPQPSPVPMSNNDVATASAPSTVTPEVFGVSSPQGSVGASPFQVPPQRTISADELFAEDAPKDETETPVNEPPLRTPEKTAAPAAASTDDDEDNMDDVPLSPSPQPLPSTTPTNGEENINPAASGEADSLFAAIGMPPPPFSAKKR